jgi:pimeloyl-ACP methyl ester carboxylesterase
VDATEFEVLRQLPGAGSITLKGELLGDGPPVVLVHGLSATRRNVVQGSRALVKRGYRLISYDARGHGASSPAPSYQYSDLVGDLEAVLEELELDSTALVGSSMGAATAMAFTLEHPERVPALVQITPAYTGYARTWTASSGRSSQAPSTTALTSSWSLRNPAGCPSVGATWHARRAASAWSATPISQPWPRR